MAANPMSQFDVYRIGPEIKVGAFDISFTNASLFMILSTVSILLIFNLGSKKNSILPEILIDAFFIDESESLHGIYLIYYLCRSNSKLIFHLIFFFVIIKSEFSIRIKN